MCQWDTNGPGLSCVQQGSSRNVHSRLQLKFTTINQALVPPNIIEHVYIHFQAISMHYFSMLIMSYFRPQYA
jgi:hypothetical protein